MAFQTVRELGMTVNGWRFSWRSMWAWFAGGLASGGLLGVAVGAANVVLSPEDKDEFALEFAVLIAAGAAVFLILNGVLELIATLIWRTAPWWRRPWFEMVACAAICLALSHGPWVNIGFDFRGDASGVALTAFLFFCLEVAPILAALLGPYLYWRIARPQPG